MTSVVRGGRKRDEKLLARIDTIGKKLDAGETVSAREVEELAACPEIRYVLFAMLRRMKPRNAAVAFDSAIAQGEKCAGLLDDASE